MSCACGKAGYGTEQAAWAVARTMKRKEGKHLKPYTCPGDPKLWHLTSSGKIRRPGRKTRG